MRYLVLVVAVEPTVTTGVVPAAVFLSLFQREAGGDGLRVAIEVEPDDFVRCRHVSLIPIQLRCVTSGKNPAPIGAEPSE